MLTMISCPSRPSGRERGNYKVVSFYNKIQLLRYGGSTYASVLLDCRRQGTVLLTQVPVAGSTASTITKGRSSSVATVRCL